MTYWQLCAVVTLSGTGGAAFCRAWALMVGGVPWEATVHVLGAFLAFWWAIVIAGPAEE